MNEVVMSLVRLPILAFRGRVIYSRTKDEVEKSAAELLHVIEEKRRQEESVALGFDTEWKPSFVKGRFFHHPLNKCCYYVVLLSH